MSVITLAATNFGVQMGSFWVLSLFSKFGGWQMSTSAAFKVRITESVVIPKLARDGGCECDGLYCASDHCLLLHIGVRYRNLYGVGGVFVGSGSILAGRVRRQWWV